MLTFTFTIDPERKEVVFSGNIKPQEALFHLQQIAIADAVNKARETEKLKEGYEASQMKAEKEALEGQGAVEHPEGVS